MGLSSDTILSTAQHCYSYSDPVRIKLDHQCKDSALYAIVVITIALTNLHCNIKHYFQGILSAGVLDSDFCYSAGYWICQIFLKNLIRYNPAKYWISYTQHKHLI